MNKIKYFFVLLLLKFISCANYIPMWSCDFENGLCHWLQNHDDGFDWEFENGAVHDIYDHTKLLGKYLSTDSRNAREGDKASLMSPSLRPSNGSCKMIFYHIHDNSWHSPKATLEVILVTKYNKRSIYKSSIDYASWKKEELSLKSDVEFQINIVATVGDFHTREIALDDVLFTDDCFTVEKSSVQVVKLSKSPVNNFPEGILFEKQNNSWSIICTKERAKLACRQLGLADVLEESFSSSGYYSGQKICQPNNITAPATLSCSTTSSCNEAVYWKCKQSYLAVCPSLTHSSCTSSGTNTRCFGKTQLCDFVNDCPGGEDESSCLENKRCNFDTDTCDWIASKNTLFEWERYKGMTDAGSSPQFYMRVDTSHAPTSTAIARLKMLHAVQGHNNASCWLRFYYHIIGGWRGSLSLIVKENNTEQSIWTVTRTGQTGDIKWQRKALKLPNGKLYHVLFQASHVGAFKIGEFGVNNISFSSSCKFINYTRAFSNSSTLFHCKSGDVIQRKLVCDFKTDCFDGSDELDCGMRKGRCSFENSLCGWTVRENSIAKMTRWRGGTPSSYTGPKKDHTSKFTSGYYMYLEASNLRKGDQAYMLSNVFTKSKSGQCTFRWFYHMYDEHEAYGMGKLQILLYNPIRKTTKLLWTKQYNQGSSWKYGSVTFNVEFFKYQIMIVAERGQYYRSDIAIDDVSFSEDCYEADYFAAPVVTQNCSLAGGTFFNVSEYGGTITSPIYSLSSQPVTCSWKIVAPTWFRIYLKSSFIKLTSTNDYLKVYANNTNAMPDIILGNRPPFQLVSFSNTIHLEFHTENASSDFRFLLTFNLTTSPALTLSDFYNTTSPGTRMSASVQLTCQSYSSRQDFSGGSGQVVSRRYANNIDCTYKFFGTYGYRLYGYFSSFSTEPTHDYIEVDGIPGSPSRRSGNLMPFYFITKSNVFSLRYRTDHSIRSQGFVLRFSLTLQLPSPFQYVTTSVTPPLPVSVTTNSVYTPGVYHSKYFSISCTGLSSSPISTILESSSTYGRIISPNYPSRYPSGINCFWTSRNLTSGKRFIIQFKDFSTESPYDYLILRDGNSMVAPKLKTLSGYLHHPDSIRTSENKFSAQFYSDGSISSTGFSFLYSTYPGCYHRYLLGYYTYMSSGDGDAEQCIKVCKNNYYLYAAFSVKNCYCGLSPPSTYQYYLLHPSRCLSCNKGKYQCGSSDAVSMYYTSDELSSKTDKQTKSSKGVAAIVGSLTTVALVAVFCVAYCYYKKKKRNVSTSPRDTGRDINRNNTPISNPAISDQTYAYTSHAVIPNVAYYVPSRTRDDAPPAYNDVVEGRVFFFNQLYGPVTSITPIDGLETPPSFSDAMANQSREMPPKYETLQQQQRTTLEPTPLSIQVQGAEASAPPERTSSPIPPKPDPVRVSLDSVNGSEDRTNTSNQELQRNSTLSNRELLLSNNVNLQPRNMRNLPPINRRTLRDNPAFNSNE